MDGAIDGALANMSQVKTSQTLTRNPHAGIQVRFDSFTVFIHFLTNTFLT